MRRLFVVTLEEGVERPNVIGGGTHVVTHARALRSAQLVEATDPRAAAESYDCSIWDLEVGLPLVVRAVGPRTADARFVREHAVKAERLDRWGGSEPVTIERPR